MDSKFDYKLHFFMQESILVVSQCCLDAGSFSSYLLLYQAECSNKSERKLAIDMGNDELTQ